MELKVTITDRNEIMKKLKRAEELLAELNQLFGWDIPRKITLEVEEPEEKA